MSARDEADPPRPGPDGGPPPRSPAAQGRAIARPAELRLAPGPVAGGSDGAAGAGPPRASLLDRGTAAAWKQVRGQYTDFLPEQEAISGRRHSPLATALLVVIAAFFLCFLLWASLAEVQQSVAAPGQVRPDGRVKVVNHA